MEINQIRWGRSLAILALIGAVTACGLPRSGPKKNEILEGAVAKENATQIIPVDRRIAQIASKSVPIGFGSTFRKAGLVGSDTIQAGDKLALRIWENVDQGLLAVEGTSVTPLNEVQVDGDGFIFVPYAGRLQAAGNSPESLRRIITAKLAEQTPDPQVEVARVAGDGATVSVTGDVGAQGVYPIERSTRSLASMIAKAGGVTADPEITEVKVTRGKRSGTARLKDIYENPEMDIPVRPGDIILVQEDPRSFTALGALGAQTRVKFPSVKMNAVEAIAQVGGLQTNYADPTGVFVLRDERSDLVNEMLGRTDLTGRQRVAYVINLTDPEGIFNARDFLVRDGDTLYVTEAPYVQWQKSLAVLTGAAATAGSLSSVGQ